MKVGRFTLVVDEEFSNCTRYRILDRQGRSHGLISHHVTDGLWYAYNYAWTTDGHKRPEDAIQAMLDQT